MWGASFEIIYQVRNCLAHEKMNPGDVSSGKIWLPGAIRFNVLLGKTKRRIFKRSVVVIEMCIGPVMLKISAITYFLMQLSSMRNVV